MNPYQLVSTVLALSLYVPLAWQILTGQVTQNLATFILWGLLDAIAAASMFKQKGNWQLPATYVGGCMVIVGCLLRSIVFQWTIFETIVSIMVVSCIVGWKMSGPRMATILSTTGMVIAGFPQLKDAWYHPVEMPFLVYIGFTVVNVLSTVGGKAWTVEDRLYPVACTVLCFLTALFAVQKFL